MERAQTNILHECVATACTVASTLTDHGGAPCKCSLGALEEIIDGLRAKVRLHQAGVDIYPPRYHHAAISLDHLDTPRYNQILAHLPAKGQMHVETKGWVKGRKRAGTIRCRDDGKARSAGKYMVGGYKGVGGG